MTSIKRNVTITRILCTVAFPFPVIGRESSSQDPLYLNTGWHFRKGDSPVDSSGEFVWFKEDVSGSLWTESADANPPRATYSGRDDHFTFP